MGAWLPLDPLYGMILLGLSYSVCASALWPSIPLLVPLKWIGTANGVATSMQMLGIGVCNIIVGSLKDSYSQTHPGRESYTGVMIFFLVLGVLSCVISVLLLF